MVPFYNILPASVFCSTMTKHGFGRTDFYWLTFGKTMQFRQDATTKFTKSVCVYILVFKTNEWPEETTVQFGIITVNLF